MHYIVITTAGINNNNLYVFGIPGETPYNFLLACELLKKFAVDAKVKYPESYVRKNLVSKIIKLSLDSDEREHVMDFMGHSQSTNKSVYRQPELPTVLNFAAGNERTSNCNETSYGNFVNETLCENSINKTKFENSVNKTTFENSVNEDVKGKTTSTSLSLFF